MDIKNVGEFVSYCQQYADDPELAATVEFADRWTNLSDSLGRQYGSHGQGMDEWVDEAYRRMVAGGVTISQDQLVQTHEILSRFWRHGEAFDKWFKSKVIIVQS
jgi:hypothetical protein